MTATLAITITLLASTDTTNSTFGGESIYINGYTMVSLHLEQPIIFGAL
jgi:hypothetical protein